MAFEPLPLNEDTLTSLLNEGSERDGLDYKSVCDLNDSRDRVELVKDLGAMQMRGGYIVVGADNNGRPTGQVTEQHAKLFDQATLHAKVRQYLADGFEIRSAALAVDGNLFGLVCVLEHPDVIAPFKVTATTKDDKGRDKTVFQAGDVFTRRGTRSERWSHEDMRHVLARIRQQEREAVRVELRQDFEAIQEAAQQAVTAAQAPSVTLTWALDIPTLTGAITEQLRTGDDIPLTLLLKSAPRTGAEAIAKGDVAELERVLDAVVSVAARLLTIERPRYVERAIDAMQGIYNTTFDKAGLARSDLPIAPAVVQLAVVTRAQALGALSVRERTWEIARHVADRPVAEYGKFWSNWLVHGEVMAARANLLQARGTGQSPLAIAREHIVRLAELRPDVGVEDEAVMTSLCQFDITAAFVALSLPNNRRDGFLAYFAQWFAVRTDPIVVQLIAGGDIRDIVFPHSDDKLAAAIRTIARNAHQMAHAIHGWHGYEAPEIDRFLTEHPPPSTA